MCMCVCVHAHICAYRRGMGVGGGACTCMQRGGGGMYVCVCTCVHTCTLSSRSRPKSILGLSECFSRLGGTTRLLHSPPLWVDSSTPTPIPCSHGHSPHLSDLFPTYLPKTHLTLSTYLDPNYHKGTAYLQGPQRSR